MCMRVMPVYCCVICELAKESLSGVGVKLKVIMTSKLSVVN
jgi:hypothetical protein